MRSKIVALLNRAGGWKARQQIGSLIEEARCSFSAAQSYEDKKDWIGMLVEIEDGIKASDQIGRILKALNQKEQS